MYSRKFEAGIVPPPNYGGVSYRPAEDPPIEQDPERRPRRPLYECETQISPATVGKQHKPDDTRERPRCRRSGLSALAGHSFTMEDIVLAGVILLLLTGEGKESDTDLILLLGFLLLAGL